MQSKKIKSKILIVITGIICLLTATLWFSLYTIQRLKANLEIQVHTRTVIIALKNNLNGILITETSERGFVLTGDTTFIKSINSSITEITTTLSQLRTLLRDNDKQHERLGMLQDLVYAKLVSTQSIIEAKKSNNVSLLQQLILAEKDRNLLDKIRYQNTYMQKVEEILFSTRFANTNSSIQNAFFVFILEGVFSILITLFLAFIIVNELKRRSSIEVQLKQNNIDLKSKNQEIEQFAYIASHDLQEPLRSISNFTRLLNSKLTDHPDPNVKEYMGFVSGAAGRMSNLIFDLLEYSRIGKSGTKYPIDCNELVKEVLSDLSVTIKESKAKITVGTLPTVYGYVYLKSIFQNLISNSIKFIHKNNYPVIDIFATENNYEYIFTVKDNGIGIEESYLEKIFIIFQRLHTREEFPGTGIGLAQCKKIIELHGGTVHVESELNKGSSFIFTIPKY